MSSVPDPAELRLLAVTQGHWGERIVDNISRHCPPLWQTHHWPAPRALPPVIDDPADFLPPTFAQAHLLLALGETAALAQLIPDIVKRCGAQAVIAPIDRNESLPPGLAAQLKGWLDDLGVAAVFPKPFCSLTGSTYNQLPIVVAYDDPIIRAFARQFGRPELLVTVDNDKHIGGVTVARDSACGCARFVAEGLIGCSADQAEYESGMLHHHYPCLASMTQDTDYYDTLMHVSGHILRVTVKEQLKDHLEPTLYVRPANRVEITGD